MLLPMPAVPMQAGPPSTYARSMKPIVLAALVFQTVMCCCRIFLFLDIMGGFIMAICIGVGWYAWREDMNIGFICYWAMMCLVNGAFDLVKWIDGAVKSPLPVFSTKMPAQYNFVSAIALCIPLSVLLGAPIGWRLYKHYTEGDVEERSYLQSGPRRAPSSDRAAERGSSIFGGGGQQQRIFGGTGQRLGDA
mmetsp:Transcript_96504/g.242067  ORF Transcript_96504/g.242067 Transcript_96504/m.242067 type:complete len:192 (-) Transcript_96504:56-631(-)